MYDNIGGKIKQWAKVVCIAEAIVAVIGAIVMMATAEDGTMIGMGFLVLILGPLAAWVSSWLLYGFGEIIVKLTQIEENTRLALGYEEEDEYEEEHEDETEVREAQAAQRYRQAKIDRITHLRNSGLITEEQYRQAISNPDILDKF